ncbi:uncharacterized protein LOC112846838 [Oreochromis niloticus]|uniref:uncharacterized protein LOC112846838 n=1 Tax=Oreochromis niloticus TaxID=8128 RepID=UPI000DF182F1|nr:uncharacterized protein LOC112846838 [Oreochromis niloticus]
MSCSCVPCGSSMVIGDPSCGLVLAGSEEEIERKSRSCFSSNEYPGYIHVFTDGAKSPDTGITRFGIVVPSKNIEINRRTSDGLAVYTVEMVAILVALKWIECSKLRQVVVCSDSAAVLSSLQSFCSKTRQGMLFTILETISRIRCCGGNIHFLWVPAHVGISGNQKVDRLAKGALTKHRTEMEIKSSGSEAKGFVWRQVGQEWQERWDSGSKGRQLYHFKEEVAGCRLYGGNRRAEVVITRLRLGHCALNKTLQMIGEHETGLCGLCQEEEETVEHVILRCKGYDVERKVLQNRLRERGIGEFNLKSVLEGSRAQIVSSLSDPYSGTVGGGNAPLHWLPTAVKHKEEEEEATRP